MPVGGRREPVSIEIAAGTNAYGEPESTTTVSTWCEIVTEQTGATYQPHEVGEDDTTRIRIRYLDSHEMKPASTKVTLQGREMICRRVLRDPRRRWIELHVS